MNNEELLKEMKEEFKRHMGILLEQHKKEIQTVGEGHSDLVRKMNDLDAKITEGRESTEKQLDRLTIAIADIKEDLKAVTKEHARRLKKVEEKVGI